MAIQTSTKVLTGAADELLATLKDAGYGYAKAP